MKRNSEGTFQSFKKRSCKQFSIFDNNITSSGKPSLSLLRKTVANDGRPHCKTLTHPPVHCNALTHPPTTLSRHSFIRGVAKWENHHETVSSTPIHIFPQISPATTSPKLFPSKNVFRREGQIEMSNSRSNTKFCSSNSAKDDFI